MLNKVIGRLFGTRHERERKRVQPIINEIVSIEERLATLPDSEIQAQTAKFRAMLAERVGPIESRIEELKAAKRVAADAA
jgi:preprotein translocase subunit SecA